MVPVTHESIVYTTGYVRITKKNHTCTQTTFIIYNITLDDGCMSMYDNIFATYLYSIQATTSLVHVGTSLAHEVESFPHVIASLIVPIGYYCNIWQVPVIIL